MRQQTRQLALSLRSCRTVPPTYSAPGRRALQIQVAPSSSNPSTFDTEPISASPISNTSSLSTLTPTGNTADARFEVLGSTSSLLSISLSASQNLYTRRGTLVSVSGNPENAISSLSPLSPLQRLPLGIPFLYQKISSTTPVDLLVATKGPHTSFAVVHLDGRVDWQVAQRNGVVAWTGHTLGVTASMNAKMSLAHWGNSRVTGRGLVALAGAGQIYQVSLKAGEQYVAHPSNVLAYTITSQPPQPFRFRSTTLRLQLPNMTYLSSIKFFREMRKTTSFRTIANVLFTLRTWTRRTIWGDRLFLNFQGPGTILLQSRGSRIRDVLSNRDVAEIAEAPAGVLLNPGLQGKSLTSYSSASPPAGSDAARQDVAIKTGDAIQEGAIEGETRRDADTRPLLKKLGMRFATVKSGKLNWEEGERQKSSP